MVYNCESRQERASIIHFCRMERFNHFFDDAEIKNPYLKMRSHNRRFTFIDNTRVVNVWKCAHFTVMTSWVTPANMALSAVWLCAVFIHMCAVFNEMCAGFIQMCAVFNQMCAVFIQMCAVFRQMCTVYCTEVSTNGFGFRQNFRRSQFWSSECYVTKQFWNCAYCAKTI